MNSSKSNDNTPQWLAWAREIQSLAQTGNHYAENEYNRERYRRLNEIAAEIISQHSELSYEPLVNAFKAQIGYATPRVDVRGAVFRDGKLLLVREIMDGGWTMPGGWADVGETPSAAVEREVWEEAGFCVKARQVVGVYDANRVGPLEVFHAYKLVFLCDLVSGVAKPSSETSEVAFFSAGDMPTDLSSERTKPRHIQDAFEHLAHPNLQAVFD
jgi:ADP-ribose pyrophosphatase YjhB (NUDIX family)